jgi:hypothetical protein
LAVGWFDDGVLPGTRDVQIVRPKQDRELYNQAAGPRELIMAAGKTTTKARRFHPKYRYDVVLSFAGEDRRYVERVAKKLTLRGIRVFYDRYEQVELWGKDLYVHLSEIYSKTARYCVMFVSNHYVRKLWANHERRSAQERAFQENREYILPVRFDESKVPGLLETIGYLDLKGIEPSELARNIARKVGTPPRAEYLPPEPDLLFRSFVETYGEIDLELLRESAEHFLDSLRRTNAEEREAIIQLFLEGCPNGLPRNIHINADLLARSTTFSANKLVSLFTGLRSLGFRSRVYKRRRDTCNIGQDTIISVEWHDMNVDSGLNGNTTSVAYELMKVKDFSHCDDCALAALRRLDFSHLCSATLNAHIRDAGTGRTISNPGLELRKRHPLKTDRSAATARTRKSAGRKTAKVSSLKT